MYTPYFIFLINKNEKQSNRPKFKKNKLAIYTKNIDL